MSSSADATVVVVINRSRIEFVLLAKHTEADATHYVRSAVGLQVSK